MLPSLKTLKASSQTIGTTVIAIGLFVAGYQTHRQFTKPVETVVQVPVYVANPEKPEHKVENTVEPAHHTISSGEMPVAPSDPLTNVHSTTMIEVPVIVPQLVKVFHQNSLSFSEQDQGYDVWVDSRVWATGEDGKDLPGLHAQTLFNRDANLFIPKTVKIPPSHPWAIGVIGMKSAKGTSGYGLFVDYDLAFTRLGIEVLATKTDLGVHDTQVLAKAGVRF